jgi:hypothetical protein
MTTTADINAMVDALLADGAAAQLPELAAASPSDIPLLAFLTAACESAGDVERARRVAHRWVEAAPLDPYAHYKLAILEQRLQNYPGAAERLRLAMGVAGPDDGVALAAGEALQAIEAIQMHQVAALLEVDMCFRVKSSQDTTGALSERGFSLSPGGVRQVRSMARAAIAEPGRHVHPS